jgi:hypothetical protein
LSNGKDISQEKSHCLLLLLALALTLLRLQRVGQVPTIVLQFSFSLMDPDRLFVLQAELLCLQRSLLRVSAEVKTIAGELHALTVEPPPPCLQQALLQYERQYIAWQVYQQAIDAGALRPLGFQGFIVDNEDAVFGELADPSVVPVLTFTPLTICDTENIICKGFLAGVRNRMNTAASKPK